MFITSKNKYLSNDMKIFGTCSIPLTVCKIENTKTEMLHLILLILNGFDSVRMFTVILVMSEINICETPANMNAHPAYHHLTDPKTLVQTGMYKTKEIIPGNVLQQRTDEWKSRKTVVQQQIV